MSIWVEIVCDQCADVLVDGIGPAELRAKAKGSGWTARMRQGHLRDYCPKCSEKPAKKLKPKPTTTLSPTEAPDA